MAKGATIDFGFDPAQSPHHFAVATQGGLVLFTERFAYDDGKGDGDGAAPEREPPQPALKAQLDAYRWSLIERTAADILNAELRAEGGRAAAWRSRGDTLLAPRYGKELVLLAWATEGQDPSVIPTVCLNWGGFAPEERWWLYSTVNATSRQQDAAERGWRKAIRIALAENPTNEAGFSLREPAPPEPKTPRRTPRGNQPGLFDAPVEIEKERTGTYDDIY